MAKARIRTLDQACMLTRTESKISMEEASNQTGIPESTLYRKLSPTDPDVRLKDSEIVPICNAFKKYYILDVFAQGCNRVMIELPRCRKGSAPDPGECQIKFKDMYRSMLEFEKNPTETNASKFLGEAHLHVQDTIALQKKVEYHSDQIDLELDE